MNKINEINADVVRLQTTAREMRSIENIVEMEELFRTFMDNMNKKLELANVWKIKSISFKHAEIHDVWILIGFIESFLLLIHKNINVLEIKEANSFLKNMLSRFKKIKPHLSEEELTLFENKVGAILNLHQRVVKDKDVLRFENEDRQSIGFIWLEKEDLTSIVLFQKELRNNLKNLLEQKQKGNWKISVPRKICLDIVTFMNLRKRYKGYNFANDILGMIEEIKYDLETKKTRECQLSTESGGWIYENC